MLKIFPVINVYKNVQIYYTRDVYVLTSTARIYVIVVFVESIVQREIVNCAT